MPPKKKKNNNNKSSRIPDEEFKARNDKVNKELCKRRNSAYYKETKAILEKGEDKVKCEALLKAKKVKLE